MRAVIINKSWGLDELKVVERDETPPGSGQVQVKLRAASLNYRDYMTVIGVYNPKMALPLVPCSDGAGEITAVGEGVTGWQVGDRVMPTFHQNYIGGTPTRSKLGSTTLGGPLDGTLQDSITVSEAGLVRIPGHLSFAEAACLPCAALTAWTALISQGQLKAADTVVTQGTGGVSTFAILFAKMHGARVIATSSSDEKLEVAKNLGADELINYKSNPKWGKQVLDLTDGEGATHIVEVGGAGTLGESLRCVGLGGFIAVIGVLSGIEQSLNIIPILMKSVRMQGIFVGPRDDFEAMTRAMEANLTRPLIDGKSFRLEQSRQALEYMASGGHTGKIVIHH